MKEQTIHITGAPPIRIIEEDWPVIARVFWPESKQQSAISTDRAWVRVRRHADGRTIVYGLRASGSVEQRVGFDLDEGDDEGVIEAIRNACALVDLDPQKVFDDMPAEPL